MHFYNTYIYYLLEEVSNLFFIDDKPEQGFQLLNKVNQLIESKDIELEPWYEETLADVYNDISAYYYRQEEYQKALEWIKKALAYNSDDETYLRKKKYITATLND
jgi:tetratricopeptide (TPR) repeat protein